MIIMKRIKHANGKTYHIQATLSFAEKLAREHPEGFIIDGEKRSTQEDKAEILDFIKELREKGYKLLPECDNVDSEGKCMGHESAIARMLENSKNKKNEKIIEIGE